MACVVQGGLAPSCSKIWVSTYCIQARVSSNKSGETCLLRDLLIAIGYMGIAQLLQYLNTKLLEGVQRWHNGSSEL